MTSFQPRQWVPRVEPGTRVLVSGAGIRRLFATLPLSGYHYMGFMVDVALDLNAGGSEAYSYRGEVFRSQGGRHDVALDWRWKLGQLA